MEVAALFLIGDAEYEDGEELNATATAMGIVCCRLGWISCVMPFVGVESRNDYDDDKHDRNCEIQTQRYRKHWKKIVPPGGY